MLRNQTFIVVAMAIVVVAVFAVVVYLRFIRDPERSAVETLLLENEEGVFVDNQGQPMDFESYKKSIRIINSWATWTPFSKDELQTLNTVAGEFKDRGVVVLAVNRDEPQERIDAFLASLPPLPNITFVRDTADMLYAASAGYTMPETLIYSSEGVLLFHKRGVTSIDELRSEAEKAIAAE